MEITILESCIRCGKCAKVCPSRILTQEGANEPIAVRHVDECIGCGHCVDVCAEGAVCHEEFPLEKVHPIDYSELPSPEQLLLLCRARRSNRAMSKQQIPAPHLELILKAAHTAPTASNTQNVGYVLVTNPAQIEAISNFTLSTFEKIAKLLLNPVVRLFVEPFQKPLYRYVPAFRRMVALKREKGVDMILRRATAVLLIHTPEKSRFGSADANLAYQNASLMAESLGVAQFYTGFVCSAAGQRKGELEKMLGLEGRRVQAGMALGMPLFRYANYSDRKPIDVTRI